MTLRVVQITDTHLYADPDRQYYDVNTDATLRRVLARIAADEGDADLVLVTGDLVHDESAQGYARLRGYLAALGLPVFCLPGNHDDVEIMRRVLAGDGVSCDDWVCRKGWQLILLNSAIPGEVGGRIAGEELERLAACLQSRPHLHALICLHHPPLPSGCAWLDEGLILHNPDALFAALAPFANVRGILWGHIHQEFDQVYHGMRLLGSPSTMLQFKPGAAEFAIDDREPGYRWLELYGDGRLESGVVRIQDDTQS